MTTGNKNLLATIMTAFPLVILSAYLVLWSKSNKDFRIIIGSSIIFVLGVLIAPNRFGVVCGACFFAGLRWVIGAIGTGKPSAIIAAVAFIGLPTLALFIASRRDRVNREGQDAGRENALL